ncbi:MAG: thioredoxin domain-containing protein [Clostridiaceae bacterium]
MASEKDKKTNRLINQKSPYLLQHAYNPVDWYPWGEEAFERAQKEDKPIFLSIGYSTCHWCHVMERESFEDEEVAQLMDDTFISIKVDREERPDIDNIYMAVCQAMTGHGGWPLTILMTPDKKPFFSGTYFPKQSMHGRIGMVELVKRVSDLWKNDREDLINSAEEITKTLQDFHSEEAGDGIGEEVSEEAFSQLEYMFDEKYGGFGSAPKFPTPHNMLFLLRYYKRTKGGKALDMVLKTLDAMAAGGIFDQVGYGFHRYSTDRKWLLPHFEKMLYDQAMILMAYTEAYQATGKEKYKNIADKIFQYMTTDLKSEEGGFYSAEDADSEGEEGKFYIWSADEVSKILNEAEAEIAIKAFGMKDEGNFRDEATGKISGMNILHFEKDATILSKEMKLSENELENSLQGIIKTLKQEREKRVRPLLDDKILTDWNGLAIAALAKAGRAFENESYINAACAAADFSLTSMKDAGRLMHRYRKGEWNFYANVDDYAFLIYGLIELYESTFNTRYLKQALSLNEELIKLFWDKENGGFYFTPEDGEKVLVRTKEVYDGAIPSGNSIALLNLIRLSRISGNTEMEEYAGKLQEAFSKSVEETPLGYTQMLAGIEYLRGQAFEVVISGERKSRDTMDMISALNKRFMPNMIVVFNPINEDNSDILDIAKYAKEQKSVNGRATAYVCKNFACGVPVTDVNEMVNNLQN